MPDRKVRHLSFVASIHRATSRRTRTLTSRAMFRRPIIDAHCDLIRDLAPHRLDDHHRLSPIVMLGLVPSIHVFGRRMP
jgi:hypothetical protein